MSFSFDFNVNDNTFKLNTNGIQLNISFDGVTVHVSSECLNANNTNVSNVNANANASSMNASNNINTDIIYIQRHIPLGITTYIHDVNKDISLPYKNIFDIIDDANVKSYTTAFELIQNLHRKIDPRLNGVCIEALLYQALSKSISLSTTVTEKYNFNVICRDNFIQTHRDDANFNDVINRIFSTYAMVDFEAAMPTRISFNNCNIVYDSDMHIGDDVTFNLNISDTPLGVVLYLAAYAYNNSEKREFQQDNYTLDNIVDYCCMLLSNIDAFENLCSYINAVATKLKTLHEKITFTPDVPVDTFNTKSYTLSGNVDLLATSITSNNETKAYVFDIKCCKCDDRYSTTAWPAQLNLYAEGLKNKYSIKGLYIINIYTNHIYTYDVDARFDVSTLE